MVSGHAGLRPGSWGAQSCPGHISFGLKRPAHGDYRTHNKDIDKDNDNNASDK